MSKKQNIIFLDIDGVLNCQLFFEERYENAKKAKKKLTKAVKKGETSKLDFYKSKICSKRMEWFNELCEEVEADVVISSTWRKGYSMEDLTEILQYCGARFSIIDKTPNIGYARGSEIREWLRNNITEEDYGCQYFDFYRYAIIDDDSDMLIPQAPNFFQTDNYSGLTPNTCYKIKRFFKHKTF